MKERILIVQTAFLGDIVLSTPVFDAIRELHPNVSVDLLTTPAGVELLEGDPRFETLHAFEKRKGFLGLSSFWSTVSQLKERNYSKVYSLHRSIRTSLLLSCAGIGERIGFYDSKARLLYTRCVKRKGSHAVEKFLSILESDWIQEKEIAMLYDRSMSLPNACLPGEVPHRDASKPTVLVIPGSAWKTKQWHWTNYRAVTRELAEEGFQVFLTGSKTEFQLCEKIRAGSLDIQNVAGKLSLREFATLVFRAQGVICNDSFALHVASAAQVPTVAVFCATSPSFGFGPWKNPHAQVVEKSGLWCKPCRRHGSMECPTGTEHCMRGVTSEEVLHAFRECLSGNGGRRDELKLFSEMTNKSGYRSLFVLSGEGS
ncbi:MAG: glycosyltransferase family 9 protein [Bdellovibrionota bacterium]